MTDWEPTPRQLWLMTARNLAEAIAIEKGTVTVNDVREACPPPDDDDPRVMGGVFRDKRFTRIGYRNSRRRACHGRPIGIFALRD